MSDALCREVEATGGRGRGPTSLDPRCCIDAAPASTSASPSRTRLELREPSDRVQAMLRCALTVHSPRVGATPPRGNRESGENDPRSLYSLGRAPLKRPRPAEPVRVRIRRPRPAQLSPCVFRRSCGPRLTRRRRCHRPPVGEPGESGRAGDLRGPQPAATSRCGRDGCSLRLAARLRVQSISTEPGPQARMRAASSLAGPRAGSTRSVGSVAPFVLTLPQCKSNGMVRFVDRMAFSALISQRCPRRAVGRQPAGLDGRRSRCAVTSTPRR